MPTWPVSLPQKQFLGTTDQRRDAVLRSQTSVGPFKTRRRATVVERTVPVPITLNAAERTTFDTFYITTLKEGSDAFDWEDPVSDAVVSFAFAAPPNWRNRANAQGRFYETVMQLVLLP